MIELVWGKYGQLEFIDEHEYYQALGGLCRNDLYSITFEKNTQTHSWGDAYRIRLLNNNVEITNAFNNAMRDKNRINCNPYVENLLINHRFEIRDNAIYGDFEIVKETVPESYYDDFERGYNV